MTPRIAAALAGTFLAALGLFATPQTQPAAKPAEAARLNNLGAAYMNQQLFEKGLKCFQQAAELDPKLTIARLNQGIALLNLQKIDEANSNATARHGLRGSAPASFRVVHFVPTSVGMVGSVSSRVIQPSCSSTIRLL